MRRDVQTRMCVQNHLLNEVIFFRSKRNAFKMRNIPLYPLCLVSHKIEYWIVLKKRAHPF